MGRVIDVSARKMGVAIAAMGATAYYMMNKYGNSHEIDKEGEQKSPPALSSAEFLPFKLSEVIPVNHNTNIYRFILEKPNQPVNLPVASFLLVKVPSEDGKTVSRPYTPISSNRDFGHFDLMIKTYPQGNVSKYVSTLKPGQFLDIKGPIKKLDYTPNMKERIGMIAGGTGITPMLQILEESILKQSDKTKFDIVYANVSPADILKKDRLDFMASRFPDRIKVHYIVDKGDASWTGSTGYINRELIQKYMPDPSNANASIYVCGPPGMMELISGNKAKDYTQGELKGHLKELGYKPDQVLKF